MAGKQPISVFIADDHLVFVEGLRVLLDKLPDIRVTGVAYNGKELLDLLKTDQPDVILLDLKMPVLDGWKATKAILRAYPGIHILVLTSLDSRKFLAELFDAGVRGFLVKHSGIDEITEAIYAIRRGELYLSEKLRTDLISEFRHPTGIKSTGPKSLTSRENQILKLIAKEFTNQEIANVLHISPHTVRAHRSNLIGKLGVKNTAGLVRYALLNGLGE